MSDQLKLAEAMGLGLIRPAYLRPDGDVGIPLANGTDRIFDPYINANDTEAVIEFMSDKFTVSVTHKSERHPAYVELYGPNDVLKNPSHKWYDDNWKRGVCELALKVINETDGA